MGIHNICRVTDLHKIDSKGSLQLMPSLEHQATR